MRIAFIGDIVGRPGMDILRHILPDYLRSKSVDVCIINGENSAAGMGITFKLAQEMVSLGADAITLGNHTFSNAEFVGLVDKIPQVVRPANVSDEWPGNDYCIINKCGKKIAVLNLLGQVSMIPSADNPFRRADKLIADIDDRADILVLDFHAEATSEKQLMGYYLDGRVSLVAGTHTHVQTADNRILPNGTGYITDLGMTGCIDSIIGMDIDASARRLISKMPAKYSQASGDAFMCGVLADIDDNGSCIRIERICEYE